MITIATFDKFAPKLKKDYKISNNFIFGVNAVGIGLIAYFYLIALLFTYNITHKFMDETTIKYINKKIAECPEYNQFKDALKDPVAIKRVATLISNELRENEQERVVDIITQTELAATDEQINKAYDKIIKIIEEHTSVHPEFLEKVYDVLARESYDIYVRQKQKENAKLLQRTK